MMGAVPNFVSRVFTPQVLATLASVRRPPAPRADHAGEVVRLRHKVFSGEQLTTWSLKARRVAWWGYLEHAEATGLLDELDLRERLASPDDANFRGALAECMTSWFFHENLGVGIRRHVGQDRHADFVGSDNLHVEVKAPHVPVPGSAFSGDDADVLRRSIQEAGGQFKKDMVNVIVLVPTLRTPVWMNRDQLVKAVVGEWALSVPVPLDPAVPAPEAMAVFLQRGKLAQLHEDGTRAHLTRIGGVACIEEETMLGNEGVVLQHYVHVIHNPFAVKRLSPSMFSDHPQLILHAGTMVWTDAPAG